MADPSFLNPISILTDIGGISIDITQKVTENYPKIITTNPIENGSPTTDHIINLPPRIQIQGGFSDLKLTNLSGTTLTGFTGLNNLSLMGRAKQQFDRLLELSLSNDLFEVMDGFHLFKNMQFSSLQLLKDREGFSVFFQADLQGIQIINLSKAEKQLDPLDSLDRIKTVVVSPITLGASLLKPNTALESIGVFSI